jgi:sugar diacid utilization regulator
MPHAVYVLDVTLDPSTAGRLERALQGRRGDAGLLLADKDDRSVLIVNAPDSAANTQVAVQLKRVLGAKRSWLAAVGSAENGPDGVRSSYVQALQTLDLARRLELPGPVVEASELVAFRVLLHDRAAATELVRTSLGPLTAAKGGAQPLLTTLETWFDTGGNTTETARALHLSVRAVTYRLARVQDLLGVDPADPSRRFALHAAVVAARLLGWPDLPPSLPTSGN